MSVARKFDTRFLQIVNTRVNLSLKCNYIPVKHTIDDEELNDDE